MRLYPALHLLFFCATLFAQQAAAEFSPGPAIAARAYLLHDYNSGQTLVSHNAEERIEPASLTKLMTAYVAFGALSEKAIALEQTVPVSQRAWRAEGSRMFLEPNKPVSVAELLRGIIVQSGNDACIALAEAIAGSEEAFAHIMNREARRLGMSGTHFVNSTGLPDPRHYTTARDLALLAAAVVRDYPQYYNLYGLRDFRYNAITQANRNRLLWLDPTVDGMKTGHTESAGYCLITSAKRGPRRLISIVLGAKSESARVAESQKLLNYGFQFYDTVRLYERSRPVSEIRVWKGSVNMLKAGFPYDLYVTLPRGQAEKITATLETRQPLLAPIGAGQQVGTLKVELDGKPYREIPVVALESVGVAGMFGRGWDTIRLLFK
jgi:D-alanyl-D-alanine carboxypeptidase (penicillin-binding protein 5/6)